MLESIFREIILEHYRKPRNKNALENPTVTVSMRNPMCGDEIDLMLAIEDDQIRAVGFTGQGCSISQASVSMMTQGVSGRSVDEALDLEKRFVALMRDDEGASDDRKLGDLRALQGVAKLKCALLGWNALDEAIKAHRKSPTGAMGEKLEFEDLTELPAGFDPTTHREDLP
jgi:nitrogen fixation NifU-like protein